MKVAYLNICWKLELFPGGVLAADITDSSCSNSAFTVSGIVSKFDLVDRNRVNFIAGDMGWKGYVNIKERSSVISTEVGFEKWDESGYEYGVHLYVPSCSSITNSPSFSMSPSTSASPSSSPSQAPSSSPSLPRSNFALGKPTSQTSTDYGGYSYRAVDGNKSGFYGSSSITHTALTTNPSWSVDLESVFEITRINVYNRMDCCSERLSGFKLSIWNSADEVFTYTDTNGVPPYLTSISVPQTKGDRVQIILPGPNRYLSLAEVEVLGVLPSNVPSLGPSTKPSTSAMPSSNPSTSANPTSSPSYEQVVSDVCNTDGIFQPTENRFYTLQRYDEHGAYWKEQSGLILLASGTKNDTRSQWKFSKTGASENWSISNRFSEFYFSSLDSSHRLKIGSNARLVKVACQNNGTIKISDAPSGSSRHDATVSTFTQTTDCRDPTLLKSCEEEFGDTYPTQTAYEECGTANLNRYKECSQFSLTFPRSFLSRTTSCKFSWQLGSCSSIFGSGWYQTSKKNCQLVKIKKNKIQCEKRAK